MSPDRLGSNPFAINNSSNHIELLHDGSAGRVAPGRRSRCGVKGKEMGRCDAKKQKNGVGQQHRGYHCTLLGENVHLCVVASLISDRSPIASRRNSDKMITSDWVV
jgi:hypothetical protein